MLRMPTWTRMAWTRSLLRSAPRKHATYLCLALVQALQFDVTTKLDELFMQEGALPRFVSGKGDKEVDLAAASQLVRRALHVVSSCLRCHE